MRPVLTAIGVAATVAVAAGVLVGGRVLNESPTNSQPGTSESPDSSDDSNLEEPIIDDSVPQSVEDLYRDSREGVLDPDAPREVAKLKISMEPHK